VIERQLPYIASATVPGAALIVAGAVLGAGRPGRRGADADERIERLYDLLMVDLDTAADADSAAGTEDAPPPASSAAAGDDGPRLVAVAEGTLYHRDTCPMVTGKAGVQAVDAEALRSRALKPCPVCDPPAIPPPDRG
jgi:hypothetical protein